MEKNKTRAKETGLLVGAEGGVLPIEYRIVGRGFPQATLGQRPEGSK